MIRSALDYTVSLMQGVANTRSRALLKAHLAPFGARTPTDRERALREAVDYLLRTQRHGQDAGMGSYHLVKGWGASYPETTGYSIPSLLAAADRYGIEEARMAAIEAAEWLLTIQHPDGGWQGGRIGEGRPSIVFNTAQVIRGMLAMYTASNDERYLQAASNAATWIASVQDKDGAWRASNFLGKERVYDTYVDAPLLRVRAITGDQLLKEAAERNLGWVLDQQQPNGWFANCDNTVRHNDRPITHTIAYTIDGLLECDVFLPTMGLASAASKAAHPLLDQYLNSGALHGRYDAQWKGSEHPLMTGCAQLAICWASLFERSGDTRCRDGATRMTNDLMAVQAASQCGPEAQYGAMPGSYPLWGRYEKFAFPNWATKYFIDALLAVEGIERSSK